VQGDIGVVRHLDSLNMTRSRAAAAKAQEEEEARDEAHDIEERELYLYDEEQAATVLQHSKVARMIIVERSEAGPQFANTAEDETKRDAADKHDFVGRRVRCWLQ
jgi:hypothetical protein